MDRDIVETEHFSMDPDMFFMDTDISLSIQKIFCETGHFSIDPNIFLWILIYFYGAWYFSMDPDSSYVNGGL